VGDDVVEQQQKTNTITLAEQRQQELLRPVNNRFVPAMPAATPVKPADFGVIEYNIQTPPTAMTTTETAGTHVHRGLEFLIKTSVLAFALAILTVAVVVVCWNQPLLGAWTLLSFWVTFACVWAWAYWVSAANSSEGIARLQAESQCDNLTKVLDARIEDYRERARLERMVYARQNGLETEE
jgi:hypothetical protein